MNETIDINAHEFILVLSVGGSPQPLIESIRHYKPGYVIFIASRDSNAKVMEILQQVELLPRHEILTLSDYQNLLACVRDIRYELPRKLDLMNLSRDILIIADITGGTKIMSAALTLAMMEFNSRFTYVGGNVRTKAGLGTVESGHEIVMPMDNPWDAMGLKEARSLVQEFNAGQFAAARQKADFLKSKDTDYSSFYSGLGTVIDAFRDWDIFNYKPARRQFEQGLGRLQAYNNRRHDKFCKLYKELQKAYTELELAEKEASLLQREFQKLPKGCGNAYLRDLVANARRCAKRGHYDDAVARLYSAVEKTAKISLAQKGINNSGMPKDLLCQAGDELAAKYATVPGDQVKLPLTDSFKLFCALEPEHPLTKTYCQFETELAKSLQYRNMSLLAHGYNPVKEDEYQKLYSMTLKFLNISEQDLPDFPVLEMDSIIF